MGPTDDEFKTFFETVIDFNLLDDFEQNADPNLNIPVLDDSITTDEVALQIKKLNSDKACGPDGRAPGVFKLLPVNCIVILIVIFNSVFLFAKSETTCPMQNSMLYNFSLNIMFRISNRYGVKTQFIVTFQMVKQFLLPKPFQNVILAQI